MTYTPKPAWDRYFLYDEPEFRRCLLGIAETRPDCIDPLLSFLDARGDERAEWIRRNDLAHRPARPSAHLYAAILMQFGIRACRICPAGMDWPPTMKPATKGCRNCEGEGWMHEIQFPPGTPGFTVSRRPGFFDVELPGESIEEARQRNRKIAMGEAVGTFAEIYGGGPLGNSRAPSLWARLRRIIKGRP